MWGPEVREAQIRVGWPRCGLHVLSRSPLSMTLMGGRGERRKRLREVPQLALVEGSLVFPESALY